MHPHPSHTRTDLSEAAAAYGAALIDLDRGAACALVTQLAATHGVFAVVDAVIAPAMRRIGERWKCGEIDVAAEHAATFVAREALAALQRSCTTGSWLPTARRVMAFAPCGERHELPVVMVSTVLESMGWQALTIGCDVPTLEAASMARQFRADVVCMSVTTEAADDAAVEAVQALSSAPDPGRRPEIWVGGGALADEQFAARLRAAGASVVATSLVDLKTVAGDFCISE